jgi:hypothetical protein
MVLCASLREKLYGRLWRCYQRNGSSGKQLDSHFACMAVCWRMANIGVAPALAPTRILLGPLSTQSGFQYWYLACFPDCIVALRQGIGAFFVLGMANDDGVSYPALFGLAGVLVNHLLKPKARAYRLHVEAMLRSSPTSRLRTKPNVVYEVTQLKAIECKTKKGAPLILSELILETKGGGKQKFGVRPAEFKKACECLKQMYPGLFRLA